MVVSIVPPILFGRVPEWSMGVALKANVPARIRPVGSNPTPAANMRLVLDGIEVWSYKPVHIVRLYEAVPISKRKDE